MLELRNDPPDYLMEVGEPRAAPLVVDAAGDMYVPTLEEGPWDIFIGVHGSPIATSSEPLRLRLRFGSRWPQQPPVVRFCGLFDHPILDAQRGPPQRFYMRLSKTSAGEYSIVEVLHHARHFFFEPVEALGLTDAEHDHDVLRRVRSALEAARQMNRDRLSVVSTYLPLARHPMLFGISSSLKSEWFEPRFWAASQNGTAEAWGDILSEHQKGEVYSMPFLKPEFCDILLEEVFSFYSTGLPARRPNTMNNYGIVLNDIGMEFFIDKLQALLQPLGRALFPGPGSAWDSHHCFVVRYREGEDLGLDMHTDDSDVTFNVCLGLQFSGAGLQFCGRQGFPNHRRHSFTYEHVKGHCLVHLGNKRHGADDIVAGERLNLILWNHSSEYRKSRAFQHPAYYKEVGPPDTTCLSYTHDRDFGVFKPYPAANKSFQGQGWCPPPEAEYDGFKADEARSEL